jgi:Replication protein C (RepC)
VGMGILGRKRKMIERELARYELEHALLDGVFEPARKVKDGDLRLRKVEGYFDYTDEKGKNHSNAIHLRLHVPYLLNPQAETILLALTQLSGINGLNNGLEVEPTQPALPVIFDTAEGNAREKLTALTTVRQYELLKAAGMSDGKDSYRLLKQYLEQMSEIRVHYENKATKWFGSDYFLRFRAHEDGRLIIQLNWRLAGAILGDYSYAKIDLQERRALQKDASKTLHRWLSAHLWAGQTELIKYDTLIKHIWTQEANKNTQKWRLQTIKKTILPEIAKLPLWTVEMGEKGAQITHHKARSITTQSP